MGFGVGCLPVPGGWGGLVSSNPELTMRKKIGNKLYDTGTAKSLAADRTQSVHQELFHSPEGDFFLLVHQIYVDGKRLNPHELWLDLRSKTSEQSRLRCVQEIVPLTDRDAVEWCVKTQIPATLRGYVLDCI